MLRARRRGLPLNYLLNFILNLPFECCLAGKWGFGQSPFDSCCNQLYGEKRGEKVKDEDDVATIQTLMGLLEDT